LLTERWLKNFSLLSTHFVLRDPENTQEIIYNHFCVRELCSYEMRDDVPSHEKFMTSLPPHTQYKLTQSYQNLCSKNTFVVQKLGNFYHFVQKVTGTWCQTRLFKFKASQFCADVFSNYHARSKLSTTQSQCIFGEEEIRLRRIKIGIRRKQIIKKERDVKNAENFQWSISQRFVEISKPEKLFKNEHATRIISLYSSDERNRRKGYRCLGVHWRSKIKN
jgi:hypothetical protein